ncbi:MAG: glycosyltransferase [Verrucomicrobiota bacterium]
MKIGHFIHIDNTGGGSNSVISQLRFFHANKYKQAVFYGGQGRLADVCNKLSIYHKSVPTESLIKSFLGIIPLIYILKRQKLDILILHGQWAGLLGAVVSRMIGIPRVWYIARWPSFYTDWDLIRIIRNFICERTACCNSEYVITLSHSNRYHYLYRKLASFDKIKVIPNGFNLGEILKEEKGIDIRKEYKWHDSEIHIVSVSRLETQKQIDWLLRSWKIVSDDLLHARLWIIGGGSEEKNLKSLHAELKLERCEFLGSQPNGISFMKASDFVVMTSMYESFGRVLVEAMACSRAFVASEADGFRDIAKDGQEGYLVPVGDIQLFAMRMIDLIKHKDLRDRMGQMGVKRAKDFEENKVHAKLEALI